MMGVWVWCVCGHGGCGCGCVGVVCREVIFGIYPNLRVFPNILHSCTDRTDRIHNDWVRARKKSTTGNMSISISLPLTSIGGRFLAMVGDEKLRRKTTKNNKKVTIRNAKKYI